MVLMCILKGKLYHTSFEVSHKSFALLGLPEILQVHVYWPNHWHVLNDFVTVDT